MDYRKVIGGTPVGNASLCDTCQNALIIKGYSEMQRITLCDAAYPRVRVPFKVCECSAYVNRTIPELEELKRIAWDLTSARSIGTVGFRRVAGNGDKNDE